MKTLQIAEREPWDAGAPAIHGPDLTGASANKPFFYAIPVTGERPMTFSVEDLPDGLRLDARTGFITGTAKREGDHRVLLRAENRHGKAEKEFDVAIGRGLALTPPLGWNSWNAWRRWVDDGKVRAAAEAMVASGLAVHGRRNLAVPGWSAESLLPVFRRVIEAAGVRSREAWIRTDLHPSLPGAGWAEFRELWMACAAIPPGRRGGS